MGDLDEYSEKELVQEIASRRIARDAGLCDYCFTQIGKPTTSGHATCAKPDRHRGAVPRTLLLLSDVSRVNRARCERWHGILPGDWTGADWSNAMCGEAGEVANVVKKLRRHEVGAHGALDPDHGELMDALAEEIADVYLYLDLLASFYRIDVEDALSRKFNKVSKAQNFPERLPA